MIEILVTIAVILILLISIIFHELSHGFISYLLGDSTPRDAGRLTLNPIKHIDPLGSVFLPLILLISNIGIVFGWAKPVPIDPRNYKNVRMGWILTAMAGPLSNFVIFSIMLILLFIFDLGDIIRLLVWYTMAINFVLGAFNLIPILPLDGFWLVFNILPDKVRDKIILLIESPYGTLLNIVGAVLAIIVARYTVLPIVVSLQRMI